MVFHKYISGLFLIGSLLCILASCNKEGNSSCSGIYKSFSGQTMGTTYHITYNSAKELHLKPLIDSLLTAINLDVSTYIPESTISHFNRPGIKFLEDQKSGSSSRNRQHFWNNLETAIKIHLASDGYFDPTVMPLVNYWGFGYLDNPDVDLSDSVKVDSLMTFVGLDKLEFISSEEKISIRKNMDGIQLDFSAIAKGYAVDRVCLFLDDKHINNYLVEIGGELKTKGKNPKKSDWTIGINTPLEWAAPTQFHSRARVINQAVATSGNYRNFRSIGNQIIGHTINPKTGYPEKSMLLSATVFSPVCAIADAWATGFMAMGYDRSKDLAVKLEYINVHFIYLSDEGELKDWSTDAVSEWLIED